MVDKPNEQDIALIQQIVGEPHLGAGEVVDRISASKKGEADPQPQDPTVPSGEVLGIKTGVPSNYENSLGGEPRHLTAFEVKRPPGRL